MTTKCSQKSTRKNDPRYYCNEETGRYRLRPEYKRKILNNAPKRPKTSYMLWCTAPGVRERVFDILRGEGLPATIEMLGRKFGELWNGGRWPNGDIIDKEYYAGLAKPAEEKYKLLSAQYKGKEKTKPFNEIVEKPGYIKGPTVYNKFYHDYRLYLIEKHPELGEKGRGQELNKLIVEQWSKHQVKEKSKEKYKNNKSKNPKIHRLIQPDEE